MRDPDKHEIPYVTAETAISKFSIFDGKTEVPLTKFHLALLSIERKKLDVYLTHTEMFCGLRTATARKERPCE